MSGLITIVLIIGSVFVALEAKSLETIKQKSEKIHSFSKDELKNISFHELRESLGFSENNPLLFPKDDLNHYHDIGIFFRGNLTTLYMKYCQAQNGQYYGFDKKTNTYMEIVDYSSSFSDRRYGDLSRYPEIISDVSDVCIKDNIPIFYSHYQEFTKRCSLFCDYQVYFRKKEQSRDFDHAEIILGNNYDYISFYRKQFEAFANLQKKEEEAIKKRNEEIAYQQQQKILQRKEIETNKQILRNRTGNLVMDFYTTFDGPEACELPCKTLNSINTGYSTIEESVSNGWLVSQVLSDISKKTGYGLDELGLPTNGSRCQCYGKKYFMQKKK